MHCPSCVQAIHQGAEVCPHCGFAMSDAGELFGDEDLTLRCFTDAAGIFRHKERKKVANIVRLFNDQFPGLFLSVYFSALGDVENLRQHALWLLNYGDFTDLPEETENNGGVLLLVDVSAKMATINYGYRLEPYLKKEDTFRILSKAHPFLLQGHYYQAVHFISKRLSAHLRRKSRQVLKHPERFGVKETPVFTTQEKAIQVEEEIEGQEDA